VSLMKEYSEKIVAKLSQVCENEESNIKKAALLITNAILNKKHIYIFGCTHSSILAEEVFYRAGSLAEYEPLFAPGLSVTNAKPVLTSLMERNEQFGRDIVSCSRLEKGDILVIISTSGKNAVPVEVALRAKDLGVRLVVITSMDTEPDVIIDNHVDPGDATMKIAGNLMGPISTILGAFILHSISMEIAEELVKKGLEPNVFTSANIPQGMGKNEKILQNDFFKRILMMP